MTLELSDDTLKLIAQMKKLNLTLSETDPESDSLNLEQAAVLGRLAKCAVDEEQRILLGENETVQKSVIWMWRFIKTNVEEHDRYIATDPVWSLIYNLARFTGNLAVKCPKNQTWIAKQDGAMSPHQITLLKLLDSHINAKPSACEDNTALSSFLTTTLSTLLQATKSWTTVDPGCEFSPNESLPLVSAATVLVSQMLSTALMAEQTAWEKSINKQIPGRPILDTLRDPFSAFVELIIDVLRRLDQLLPRIQFGEAKPVVTGADTPSADKASLPASRFQSQKRDLVRLLGILVHDDPSVQTRVREAGGVQLILGLCAIDENNPYYYDT
ncbi:unnamed protein product [Rhizoctonia solani]|uniref:Ataxin-10 homolog n=1 Tax=Rhizoctonia solani TaxID=456999 RepID=A0A8H3DB72_9AGAM|nr:unnamed protein product [Rhizoctonia solani]